MSFWTVSAAGMIGSPSISTHQVFSVRHWFKMVRIYTTSNSAQVIYVVFFRYRTVENLITKSMDHLGFRTDLHGTIARWIDRSHPQPATKKILFDLIPKPAFIISHTIPSAVIISELSSSTGMP